MVETDAGGDPDDEQSLVRFLLYTNEWDVEGILANRLNARDGENLNPVRTGLGIIRRQLDAYAECYPSLRAHDPRYPQPDLLRQRTVPGHSASDEGMNLLIKAVDSPDRRPLWFMNWGTDEGSGPSNLVRALEHVRRTRGEDGYAKFKGRIRLSSSDEFGEHTGSIKPPFPLFVNTFRPEIDRKRWYHSFSAITATAAGFDLKRDLLTGHGPLGALYPTNTTHKQKEGDTMSFLYLVPTGMNNPEQPGWGSWAGRYGRNPEAGGAPYYWADQQDAWEGTLDRDNTLKRWAADLQNDFRARLDWCVKPFAAANHPPRVSVLGGAERTVRSPKSAMTGREVRLDARGTTDPDDNTLQYRWSFYPEAGTYRGPLPGIRDSTKPQASFRTPSVSEEQTLHVLLTVTDNGEPPLSRYHRTVIRLLPR